MPSFAEILAAQKAKNPLQAELQLDLDLPAPVVPFKDNDLYLLLLDRWLRNTKLTVCYEVKFFHELTKLYSNHHIKYNLPHSHNFTAGVCRGCGNKFAQYSEYYLFNTCQACKSTVSFSQRTVTQILNNLICQLPSTLVQKLCEL